jgi:hypothetical protein
MKRIIFDPESIRSHISPREIVWLRYTMILEIASKELRLRPPASSGIKH